MQMIWIIVLLFFALVSPVHGGTVFMEAGTDATYGFEFYSGTVKSNNATVVSNGILPITGPRDIKFDSGTSSFGPASVLLDNVLNLGSRRISFNIKFTNFGTSTVGWLPFLEWDYGSPATFPGLRVAITNDGKLKLLNGVTPLSDGITTLSTGVVYRISFTYTYTSSMVNEWRVFLNDSVTPELSASNVSYSPTGTNRLALGITITPTAQSTWQFDDVYIDDSNSLQNPSSSGLKVTAKRAAGLGTHNNLFPMGTYTNRWDPVSQRPLSESHGFEGGGSAAAENFVLESASTGDVNISGGTVIARSAWVWAKRLQPHNISCKTSVASSTKGTATVFPAVSTTVGDLVVVGFADQIGGSNPTIVDNLGNTWIPLSGPTTNTVRLSKWYSKIAAGKAGSTTITIFHSTSNRKRAGVLGCFTNITVSPLDANPTNTTDSTSPYLAPPTGPLGQSGEIIFGFFAFAAPLGESIGGPSQYRVIAAGTDSGGATSNASISLNTTGIVESTSSYTLQQGGSTNRPGVQGVASFRVDLPSVDYGTPKIIDNGVETPIVLSANSTLYTINTDSSAYPSNTAGIGLRTSTTTLNYFYEGGTLIAYRPTAPVSTPDLYVASINNPPAMAVDGGSFNVTDTTVNSGTASAASSTTRYRLSVDNVVSGSDTLLTGTRSVPSLAAGNNSSGSVTVTIPAGLQPGNYYLGACADDLAVVGESNETNNCAASTSTVAISAPPNITSLGITSGPVGTPVTIYGSNFGATQGTSTVTFNGVAATPTSWNGTSIIAPVPAGATTGSVIVTVAGVASNGITFGVTTKLAITAINNGSNPTVGTGFSVLVQSQDASGSPANVSGSTAISLSLKTGTGSLGGTLTGSIAGGANQVTINGVTYNKAESGVVITASRTSGDALTSADSTSITVNPGAASVLVFTTQPANANTGVSISGPPTVTVQDSFGNRVTSSTASINIAIGTNPGGATLSGTSTKNASSGIAIFSDLSLNQPGVGYTLLATSAGLTSATSIAFNVASPSVTLVASPASIPAGDEFAVTWTQIPTPTSRDWIGLYTPGASGTSYLDWQYVNCTRSATVPVGSGFCSFPILSSRPPGTYEFRLLPNDTYTHIAVSNSVTVTTAINKLTVSVDQQNVTTGTPGFSMTVIAKSPAGVNVNVSADTLVTVSVKSGTGTLGGTISGTILTGTSQVTIGSATYTKAESGVVLTAARTSGDTLIAGHTTPFSVQPGPAAKLAFTTQPGNAWVKGTIPGPPTVTVQDSNDNTVTSSTQSISVSIGTNPGGGILHGNTTLTSSSFATFADLGIDQPGNGYTLNASAPGLAGASSNVFNVSPPTGTAIIAGVITRVSNGTAISGALVEVFEGTALRGTAVGNSSGNYTVAGLAAGTYTVRGSFTGLVPQVRESVAVTSGNTTTVNLSLNFGIAIQSPIAGAIINDYNTLVTGHFDTTLAAEVGITVNGYVAMLDGDEFATIVPLDEQPAALTATIANTSGTVLANHTIPVTVQLPTTEPVLMLQPSPRIALVSDPVSFTLVSLNQIAQLEFDANGDGIIDYTGTTLEGITATFAEPGLYYPTALVTDTNAFSYTAKGLIQILNIDQLDTLLQAKWNAMKNALRISDTVTAASYIVKAKQAFYQNIFNNLTISFATIDQYLPNLTFVEQWHNSVEYEITRTEGADQVTYMVLFVLDDDGIWRIKFF